MLPRKHKSILSNVFISSEHYQKFMVWWMDHCWNIRSTVVFQYWVWTSPWWSITHSKVVFCAVGRWFQSKAFKNHLNFLKREKSICINQTTNRFYFPSSGWLCCITPGRDSACTDKCLFTYHYRSHFPSILSHMLIWRRVSYLLGKGGYVFGSVG